MHRSELIGHLRALPAGRRLITALDVPDEAGALALAARLGPGGGFVKVGLELFSAAGPPVVRALHASGHDVFLDLKYHDIPNTVAAAARQAARLGAALCTIHAAAGRAALQAAAAALADEPPGPGGRRPALLAVTVLTSLSAEDLEEIAPGGGALPARVARLATLAWESGCDGLVCSAADLAALRQVVGPEPLVVTPGIRPAAGAADDQKRVATPAQAAAAGADFLVIGRPVTGAPDPAAALAAIAREFG